MRNKLLLSATLAFTLARAAWAAPNTRYLVFSMDEHGTITALHQELVTARTASRSETEIANLVDNAPVDLERMAVAATDAGGGVLFRDVVELARQGSLEIGLHQDARGQELADAARPADRIFVARVPYVAGGKLRFFRAEEGAEPRQASAKARVAAEIDLDAVAADAELRGTSAPAKVLAAPGVEAQKAASADSANRLDLLIMGDGYTAAEAGKFQSDAAKLIDKFFTIAPYRNYRNFVKPAVLFTPSSQSGSDHPPFAAACASGACCSDPAMKNDPRAGKFVDTAFDAAYCEHNLHRLISVDSAKVLAAAAGYPEWDQILVLVNDATYGGSGGEVSVASLHDLAVRLAQHEFGHSFTRLTDEYSEHDLERPACNDTAGPQCEPNATDQTGRDQIKWRSYIAQSTPVPTDDSNPQLVGLFKGARSEENGYFRPQLTCLMKDLAHDFCDICVQEFVLKLYRGWRGGTGIDSIEPGSEVPAPGPVSAVAGGSVDFRAALLSPAEGSPVAATWFVNGAAAGSGSAFRFAPTAAGTYTVELKTRDTTPLVKTAMAGAALDSSRSWTVKVGGTAAAPSCAGSGRDLCLLGNRFRVQVGWKNQHGGNSGQGTAVPMSAETGYFWFFNSGNAELMVKILDGRGVNGKFWVFYGSLSDVEYTITVTDTTNGATKTYRNPPGNMASVADTSAL